MGSVNAELIRSCERARLGGDEIEHGRLAKLVDESQEECSHPRSDRRTIRVAKDSVTRKYKKGDTIEFCGRCSKILRTK